MTAFGPGPKSSGAQRLLQLWGYSGQLSRSLPDHADIVIPTFRIREASEYRRQAAAELVAALAKENSGSDISKRTITRALERAFGSVQSSEWFGCGAYRDFIRKAAVLRCDLSERPAKGGGVSVRYKAAKPQKQIA